MTDRAINLTAPMVRAVLDGRKTQTRVVLTRHNVTVLGEKWDKQSPWSGLRFGEAKVRTHNPIFGTPDPHLGVPFCHPDDEPAPSEDCGIYRVRPDIEVDDRLRVREKWALKGDRDPMYAADWKRLAVEGLKPWRSSTQMPRWASRLTLIVTDVRVERLQDISEADAIAGGLACLSKDGRLYKWGIPDIDGLPGNDDHGWHWADWQVSPVAAFKNLWEQQHGPDSWSANPWVAAVSFDVHRCNIDAMPAKASESEAA